MTKRFLQPQEERINALVELWEPRFDLPGTTVTHRFQDGFLGSNEGDRVAETDVNYQYRDAVIRWSLPVVARLSDDDIEAALVHEYVHILIAPMELHIPERYKDEQNEAAVENVARALLKVYRSK